MQEGDALRAAIAQARQDACDTTLPDAAADVPAVEVIYRCRRTMKGHTGKIYSMSWCSDNERVVSAAQDGKLIVWDARDGEKLGAANLKSNWVMSSAFAPSGNLVASGGLDNICTVWRVDQLEQPAQELNGHAGFLSSCLFLDDKQILTSSGDTTIALWDIERGQKVAEFLGHAGDVSSIGLLPSRTALVSCSVDRTVKAWDLRERRCVQTMAGHEGDINDLSVFPGDNALVTAGDDCTCRLFDLRADQCVAVYRDAEVTQGAQCVAFSGSGRLVFGGYYDNIINVWDTLKGERVAAIAGHEARVASIGVSSNGMAMCSASWDATLRVWN